jgi:hypothetical protein
MLVFHYHPDKAVKIGARINHVTVIRHNKHRKSNTKKYWATNMTFEVRDKASDVFKMIKIGDSSKKSWIITHVKRILILSITWLYVIPLQRQQEKELTKSWCWSYIFKTLKHLLSLWNSFI